MLVQCGIVVTGALVRLTGSGLGCPTWPECVSGSLVPTAGQPEGVHKSIEFANRTLTFLVLAVSWPGWSPPGVRRPRRRPLVLLAAGGVVGVFGQAVLGGMTVLTGLNPSLVAAHLLLSMVLIAVAVALQQRGQDAGDGAVTPARPRPSSAGCPGRSSGSERSSSSLGTIVTGSGPHGGDAETPRYGFDIRAVAQLHADAVILFVALTVGAWLALRLTDAPGRRAAPGPAPARRLDGPGTDRLRAVLHRRALGARRRPPRRGVRRVGLRPPGPVRPPGARGARPRRPTVRRAAAGRARRRRTRPSGR